MHCNLFALPRFYPVALRSANLQHVFNINIAIIGCQLCIVCNDNILDISCSGCVPQETRTPTHTAKDTYSPESQRFKLSYTKRLINALSKFDIASFADVHKLHIFRHSLAASFGRKAELIDENDFYIPASGVEFLYSRIVICLTPGQIRPTLTVGHRPIIRRFHIIDITAAAP